MPLVRTLVSVSHIRGLHHVLTRSLFFAVFNTTSHIYAIVYHPLLLSRCSSPFSFSSLLSSLTLSSFYPCHIFSGAITALNFFFCLISDLFLPWTPSLILSSVDVYKAVTALVLKKAHKLLAPIFQGFVAFF